MKISNLDLGIVELGRPTQGRTTVKLSKQECLYLKKESK